MRNRTEDDKFVDDILHFTVYKNGVDKNVFIYDVGESSGPLDLHLAWDTSPVPNIQVSVKESGVGFRTTAYAWSDHEQAENSPPLNITHIAFKTTHSLTIRQKDSFLWISHVLARCPRQNAEVSCDLNINRHRKYGYFRTRDEVRTYSRGSRLHPSSVTGSTSLDAVTNNTSKVVRKVMEMKLIAKHTNPEHNYEVRRVYIV